jgi:hypothetical protein
MILFSVRIFNTKKKYIRIEFCFFIETKVVELTNENETLKAKLHLMLSRLNMKETEMENLFEEEQRLGHINLKPAISASTILAQNDTDNEDDYSSQLTISKDSETNEDNRLIQHTAVDLSRTEVKTGNLLRKSPSPLTPSPSPPNESLLQILANQMFKTQQQETTIPSSRLLTIASPTETKPNLSTLKRNFNQLQQDNDQQQKWDEAAMTLLSLNKPPPPPAPPVEQQVALQSVINGLLRKPNPPKATIDYHSQQNSSENIHQHTSFDQWKTLMNYFSMPPSQQSTIFNPNTAHSHQHHHPQQQQHEPRGDMMPLKLRMKMLNTKS